MGQRLRLGVPQKAGHPSSRAALIKSVRKDFPCRSTNQEARPGRRGPTIRNEATTYFTRVTPDEGRRFSGNERRRAG